jgi:hypothetical protein
MGSPPGAARGRLPAAFGAVNARHRRPAIQLELLEQMAPDCTGGQGTSPYEQNTQQSPGRGLSRTPQPLQS